MLLAVYDESKNDYYTALAEKSVCSQISSDEYLKDPPEEFLNGGKGYVTNALHLYKYPYLTELFTVTYLPRNAEITVLKRVENWTGCIIRWNTPTKPAKRARATFPRHT